MAIRSIFRADRQCASQLATATVPTNIYDSLILRSHQLCELVASSVTSQRLYVQTASILPRGLNNVWRIISPGSAPTGLWRRFWTCTLTVVNIFRLCICSEFLNHTVLEIRQVKRSHENGEQILVNQIRLNEDFGRCFTRSDSTRWMPATYILIEQSLWRPSQ